MSKESVRCVLSGKRLHEMVAQSVKIVVLADMVMAAKNVDLVNIAHLRRTFPRHVLTALLEDTNLIMGKQAAFHVHLESINMLKEKKSVKTVRLDVRRTLLETMQQSVMPV